MGKEEPELKDLYQRSIAGKMAILILLLRML